jgi:hypothetical protein
VIRSRRGRFLAIPTENAPRKGADGRRISPSFTSGVLARFISMLADQYEPVFLTRAVLEFSRVTLLYRKLIVMPGM